MASRIVIDGNAFYEIDEDCVQWKKKQREEQAGQKTAQQAVCPGQQARPRGKRAGRQDGSGSPDMGNDG